MCPSRSEYMDTNNEFVCLLANDLIDDINAFRQKESQIWESTGLKHVWLGYVSPLLTRRDQLSYWVGSLLVSDVVKKYAHRMISSFDHILEDLENYPQLMNLANNRPSFEQTLKDLENYLWSVNFANNRPNLNFAETMSGAPVKPLVHSEKELSSRTVQFKLVDARVESPISCQSTWS